MSSVLLLENTSINKQVSFSISFVAISFYDDLFDVFHHKHKQMRAKLLSAELVVISDDIPEG